MRLPGMRAVAAAAIVAAVGLAGGGDEGRPIGREAEGRFPPLVLPKGFRATLLACDPLVEYPSVIALGPRAGTLLVAHDYVTGLGVEIVRRDEVRLLEDADGDGYAERSLLVGEGFNSIQGLACDGPRIFVMHAPHLTVLADEDGDGVYEQRRDLLSGLGLPPEENDNRLHCANGVVVGADGWLYLALGDRGCDVARAEGDRLVLVGGGILRCRPDGRGLHVFASGLRNIYDVALDGELNVFVRDNENDGGSYMVRLCHSFFGADHGYPYLYEEHAEEALGPVAEFGRGSSAGGVCYLGEAFGREYRGSLLFCEWGRAVVRYRVARQGSGFVLTDAEDFAAGEHSDPYGFKPTDVVVDQSGAVIVSDWADGQRPRRGRGRIYRITYEGSEESEQGDGPPDSGGQQVEAVWKVARTGGEAALGELFGMAEGASEAGIRVQAIRAIADLTDPILVGHQMDGGDVEVEGAERDRGRSVQEAGEGDVEVAGRLARLGATGEARVRLEVVVALGRLRWRGTPQWLARHLDEADATLAHAAQQALRRSGNWSAVVELLDEPDGRPIRAIAARALADCAEPAVVDALIERLQTSREAARRGQYAALLARVHMRPAAAGYWGFRPEPRAANTVGWERSEAIAAALDAALADADHGVRAAALRAMLREAVPVRLARLKDWLDEEHDSGHVAAIVAALGEQADPAAAAVAAEIVRQPRQAQENRLAALGVLTARLEGGDAGELAALGETLGDDAVRAAVVRELGRRAALDSAGVVLGALASDAAEVRAAALEAATALKLTDAADRVPRLLRDADGAVRRGAIVAAGVLRVHSAAAAVRAHLEDDDPTIRSACLDALRLLGDGSAVGPAVAALEHTATARAALDYVSALGGAEHARAVAATAVGQRELDVLDRAVRALVDWRRGLAADSAAAVELERAVAEVQGSSGVLLAWRTLGPLASGEVAAARLTPGDGWRRAFARAGDGRLELAASAGESEAGVWLAASELAVPRETAVELSVAASGPFRVWLGGRKIEERSSRGGGQADAVRSDAVLVEGLNRVVLEVESAGGPAWLRAQFRVKGGSADHERLTQAALQGRGSVVRGRELFYSAEKSQCIKCHQLEGEGGRIGPDLTGVGSRYARVFVVESILDPSRAIAPSYASLSVLLADGRLLSGVKVAETGGTLSLADAQAQVHEIATAEIEVVEPHGRSTMPEGLEKRWTQQEFVDLVEFLMSQKGAGGLP